MQDTDRRRSSRFDLAMTVTLHVGGGGRTLRAKSLNVSRTGLFVLTTDHVSEGQRVELMLEPETGRGEIIFVTGVVVHAVPDYGLGVRFSALSVRADGRLMQLLRKLQAVAA
jgi:c-di-GMP-binding flagellar brake protein YcgR